MPDRARVHRSLELIREIVRKEFLQIRQDRRMVFVSVVAPILQVIILGYAATTDIKYTRMAVCDQDRTAASREFVQAFTTSGYFVHAVDVESTADIEVPIERGEASVALVIPPGFGRMLMQHGSPQVQVIFDGADANSATVLLGYATQIVSSYSQTVVASYVSQRGGMRPAIVAPEPRIWFNPDLKSRFFMVPAVVSLVLMIITMTLTSLAIVKEKEIGTLEQLLVTPIKPYQLVLGKLIPFVIIGFFEMTIVLAVARYWFGVPFRGSLPLLFGLSGLFILTTLGSGLFISTIARTQQQAMLIAQFFFFMPFIYLSGFAFPIANMPTAIQLATYVIPLRYFLEIVRGVFLRGAGLGELWPQAAALLGLGIVILGMSVLRFRRTLE